MKHHALVVACAVVVFAGAVTGCEGRSIEGITWSDAGAVADGGASLPDGGGAPATGADTARMNYGEQEFAADPSLRAAPNHVVFMSLEHPDMAAVGPGDTGDNVPGVDRIPYEYTVPGTYRYCWKEPPDGVGPHRMELFDESGKSVVSVDQGECAAVDVAPGRYVKRFTHGGGRNGAGTAVFIRPKPAAPSAPPGVNCAAAPGGAPGPLPAAKAPTAGCQYVKTAVYKDLALVKGQVGIMGSSVAVLAGSATNAATRITTYSYTCTTAAASLANAQVDVFGGDCDDLSAYAKYDQMAVVPGPGTHAMLFRSAAFSGPIYHANGAVSCPAARNVSWTYTDPKIANNSVSMKVWTDGAGTTDPATRCDIVRAGIRAENYLSMGTDTGPGVDDIGPLAHGEAAIFSEPNSRGLGLVFNGPCHDLAALCFDDNTTSIDVGPNTGIWLYAAAGYQASNQFETAAITQLTQGTFIRDKSVSSVWAETWEAYNINEIEIGTRSCEQCHLENAQMASMKLDGIDFTNALMQGAVLSNASLVGATLSGANLTNAWLPGANCKNATAVKTVFRQANLQGVNFEAANLQQADFECDAVGSDGMCDTDLGGAYMPDADLTGAHLNHVTAPRMQLYGANAKIKSATMVGVNLSNAILSELDLSQAQLQAAKLDGANLISANLTGAHLENASITGAYLQGADFTKGFLTAANLSGSVLATTGGTLHIDGVDPSGNKVSTDYPYKATALPYGTADAVTMDATTKCPNGGKGPCTQDKWTVTNPPGIPGCVGSDTVWCPQ